MKSKKKILKYKEIPPCSNCGSIELEMQTTGTIYDKIIIYKGDYSNSIKIEITETNVSKSEEPAYICAGCCKERTDEILEGVSEIKIL